MKTAEELGDDLCTYCPLEKSDRGVHGTNGRYAAGCEGSRCNDAYENYLTSIEPAEREES